MSLPATDPCPCGLPTTYSSCCQPFHLGRAWPPTAERLMRSRYSAFAVGDATWLLASWHPATRPNGMELDADQSWTRLEITATTGGGLFDDTGTVAFTAHYRQRKTGPSLSENSTFRREAGNWVYVGPVLQP